MRINGLLLIYIISMVPHAAPADQTPGRSEYETITRAGVVLEDSGLVDNKVERAHGSGVLVARAEPSGACGIRHILTNAHVIDISHDTNRRTPTIVGRVLVHVPTVNDGVQLGTDPFQARAVYIDRGIDLALLASAEEVCDGKPFVVSRKKVSAPYTGQNVYLVARMAGTENRITLRSGIISAVYVHEIGVTAYSANVFVRNGVSGGGLYTFDTQRNEFTLVGIASMGNPDAEEDNGFIAVNHVYEFLEKAWKHAQ